MPIFVQTFSTLVRHAVDDKNDSKRLNEALRTLQERGAKIVDVKLTFGVNLVFLIIYEAKGPLEMEEK